MHRFGSALNPHPPLPSGRHRWAVRQEARRPDLSPHPPTRLGHRPQPYAPRTAPNPPPVPASGAADPRRGRRHAALAGTGGFSFDGSVRSDQGRCPGSV